MDRRRFAHGKPPAPRHTADMSPTIPIGAAEPGRALPATLRLGPVHLTVSDLDRSVAWYERSLGLRVHHRDGDTAALGAGARAVLVLARGPEAGPAGRHAGLYHYALLYPTREELARAAMRLPETRTPIEGASDHGTHEAIYLPDPDGNGIELAADRPRDELAHARGDVLARPAAARLRTRCSPPSPARRRRAQVGRGLRVGHLHLHVGDVDRGLAFYRDVARLRRRGQPRLRRVRRGRRLPPPPRLQRLARPRRRSRAGAHRRHATTGPSCSSAPRRSRPCASAPRPPGSPSSRRSAASSYATRGATRC